MSDGKVLITVQGGVADYDIVEGDVEIAFWDYDDADVGEDAVEEYAALPIWAKLLVDSPEEDDDEHD